MIKHKKQLTPAAIEALISANLVSSLPTSVIKVNTNVYKLFGHYTVTNSKANIKVKRDNIQVGIFTSLSIAISWCTANNVGNTMLASRIQHLDDDKRRLSDDIWFSITAYNTRKDKLSFSVLPVKIEYKRARLSRITNDLQYCISKAKYVQIKEFNNEIERIKHLK